MTGARQGHPAGPVAGPAASASPAPTPPPPEVAGRLRRFFAEAGYTEPGLQKALGTIEPPMPRQRGLPRLLHAIREPTVFNLLVRWFIAGLPVDREAARTRLPGWFLEACEAHGLLRPEGAALISSALLAPYGEFLVAADHYHRLLSEEGFDHVLAVNPAAKYLMEFTVRRPSVSTLDLCSGCGILALAAASHSGRVVATDLNPRAAAFAAFNARLNGCENIEVRVGDGFAPVAGATFDLIVCNPPFILAPEKRYLYRDNGMELDGFCRSLLRQAAAHLNEGGLFQMIFEWVEIEGQPWKERLAAWFEGSGCDAWVLKNYTQSPAAYALMRMRETPFQSAEDDASSYGRWMDYYDHRKVAAVHGGFAALRRRMGADWLHLDEIPDALTGPFGDSILQGFAARDFLREHASDEALLAARLRLSPDLRLEQEYRCAEGHWRTLVLRLRLARGLPGTLALQGEVAEFLARFDGTRPLGVLVDDLARTAGADQGEARREALGVVRRLVERGFLVP